MGLKRGIDRVVEAAVEDIKKASKEIKEKEEIADVASVSANNDMDIGKQTADAMEKIGKDGVMRAERAF
jgi:chaperonin GroEL